jgi:hypothetical protein
MRNWLYKRVSDETGAIEVEEGRSELRADIFVKS